MEGKEIRLRRLFTSDQNAVIVAVDHGEFDGPLPGFIDLPEAIKAITPQVDGILLSPGMLSHCGHAFCYKGAPLPIMRLNWSTVYCFHWGYDEGFTVPAIRPAEAVARGAEIVLISLTLQTGDEALDAENVHGFCDLANEAKGLGLPVIGEIFPPSADELSAEELFEQVYTGCRIIAELGADAIKTFYTVNFDQVTAAVPIPIFGLGAEKTPREIDALQLARREIEGGARGVVFGRNVMQAQDPAKFIAALCEVVKEGRDPAEAAAEYGLD
jgi:class I fructose-bisphosphate aldolase